MMRLVARTAAAITLALAAFVVSVPSARAEGTELKLATLAPKGSAWAKSMEKAAKDIEARTAGRVRVKWFFSGQQGDERDVVRKIKLGQLEGAALTAVGMSMIRPDVRVLELPFLFKTDRELDLVREKLQPEFDKQFDDAGYALLAWGDVGWTYVYSNLPIRSRADLQKVKMWIWTDDTLVRALFKKLGVNSVPLGVPDVLNSLQTGLIDGCYGPPLGAVALQWYTKIKYATGTPESYGVGALLVSKTALARLSAEDQASVRTASRTLGGELLTLVRKDNERARKAMEKAGIQFVALPPATMADLEKDAFKVWEELTGKLYPAPLLAQVKQMLAEIRK